VLVLTRSVGVERLAVGPASRLNQLVLLLPSGERVRIHIDPCKNRNRTLVRVGLEAPESVKVFPGELLDEPGPPVAVQRPAV
jgi:sRNA-binding carbon storage regulator CsrA